MRKTTSRRITAQEGASWPDLAGPSEAFQVASTLGAPCGHRGSDECSVVSVRRMIQAGAAPTIAQHFVYQDLPRAGHDAKRQDDGGDGVGRPAHLRSPRPAPPSS